VTFISIGSNFLETMCNILRIVYVLTYHNGAQPLDI